MARPPGLPKSGGRKKGTPNKKTQDLEDRLKTLGIDVPSQIGALLPQLHTEKQVDILMGLMAFLYPKRKAVEQQIEIAPKEEAKELSIDEINRSLAKSYQTSAWVSEEPEIMAAYQKLADYYGSLGSSLPA